MNITSRLRKLFRAFTEGNKGNQEERSTRQESVPAAAIDFRHPSLPSFPSVKKCVFVFCALLLPLSLSSARAEETRTWPFEVPGDYSLFRQNGTGETGDEQREIEIVEGEVRLVPRFSRAGDFTLEKNFEGGTGPSISVGMPGYVSLLKAGSLFPRTGEFRSRIFDAGAGVTHNWLRILAEVSEIPVVSDLATQLDSTDPSWGGVRAIWHLDNNLIDAKNGNNGTAFGTITYTTVSKVGSHAAGFFDAYASVPSLTFPTTGQISSFSIETWVDPRVEGTSYPLNRAIISAGLDDNFQLNRYENKIRFLVVSSSGIRKEVQGNIVLQNGKWQHVAATYNHVTGEAAIYINGEIDKKAVLFPGGAFVGIGSSKPVVIGAYFRDATPQSNASFEGYIDELSFHEALLTPADIYRHYLMGGLYRGRFQVRSGNTEGELTSRVFTGPDGAGTYYSIDNRDLVDNAGLGFSRSDRYIQYRAILGASPDLTQSALINSVAITSSAVAGARDYSVGDFSAGTRSNTTVNYSEVARSFLALSASATNAYYGSGAYVSTTFDGAAGAIWQNLSWNAVANQTLSTTESGIVALWRFDGNWIDATGGDNATAIGGAGFAAIPKVGSGAAQFDGVDDLARVLTPTFVPGEVFSVMFWVRPESDGGSVVRQGWQSSPTVAGWTVDYGRNEAYQSQAGITFGSGNATVAAAQAFECAVSTPTNSVMPGQWSHVAVVKDDNRVKIYVNGTLTASDSIASSEIVYGTTTLSIGVDFEGRLDELAIFNNRALSAIEIANFYGQQKDSFGLGDIRFQVRVGTVLPLTGAFVGPDGTPDTFFTTAGGSSLTSIPGNYSNGQYLQYRAVLNGLYGETTPGVRSVRISYNGTENYTDDTADEFLNGTFEDGKTAWYAEELRLANVGAAGGAPHEAGEFGQRALWHFENSVEEANGRIATGAIAGGDTLTYTEEAVIGGYAASFDGVTQYLQIVPGDAFPFGKSDFTIATWFRTELGEDRDIFSRGNVGSGRFIRIGVEGSDGSIVLYTDQIPLTNVNSGYVDGRWHHVALVRDGALVKVYLDGVQYYEKAATVTDYSASVTPWLTIGASWQDGIARNWSGSIDEFVMYRRALDAAEVAGVYGTGIRYLSPSDKIFTSSLFQNATPIGWVGLEWGEGSVGYGDELPANNGIAPFDGTEAGMVALWHFEDAGWADAVDGYDGTGLGSVAPNLTAQQLGDGCAEFDGASALQISASGGDANFALGLNGLAFSLWINWQGGTPAGPVPVLSNDDGAEFYSLTMGVNQLLTLAFNGDVSGSVTGTIPVGDGNWHHVVGVFAPSQYVRLYIDGKLAGELTAGVPSTISPAGDLYFGQGGSVGAAGLKWDGYLDEAAFFQAVPHPGFVYETYAEQRGNSGLVALWHLNEASGPIVEVISGAEGTFNGTYNLPGKFNTALGFSHIANNRVQVPYVSELDVLNTSALTISFWLNPTGNFTPATEGTVVGRTGGTAAPYRVRMFGGFNTNLGLEVQTAGGRYGSGPVTIPGDLVVNEWNHLAFTYNPATGVITSYVNGRIVGVEDTPATSLISAAQGFEMMGTPGSTYIGGSLDEVAVFGRCLSYREIMNLYERGACNVRFQVQVGESGVWTDGEGTPDGYITETPALLDFGDVYSKFRYRVLMSTTDALRTPVVRGVKITEAIYPNDGPFVINESGQDFRGYLTNFTQILGADTAETGSSVRYRISNNGTTWYFWNSMAPTPAWEDAQPYVADYTYELTSTNTADQVAENIDRFYEQFGPGTFYFQAFLVSNGSVQIVLDEVTLNYSIGRVVMSTFNGEQDWWIGHEYPVEWTVTTGGPFPAAWDLYYTTFEPDPENPGEYLWTQVLDDAGAAQGITHDGSGNYSYTWLIPPELAAAVAPVGPSETFRLRLVAVEDPTIRDESDADNTALVPIYTVTVPAAEDVLMTGNLYDIAWTYVDTDEADPDQPVEVPTVRIEYWDDDTSQWKLVTDGGGSPATGIPSRDGFFADWKVPQTGPASEEIYVRILDERPAGTRAYGQYLYDVSDLFYRKEGFDIIRPDGGETLYAGWPEEIRWKASYGSAAEVNLYYSLDGGVTYPAEPNIAFATTSELGIENTYVWNVPDNSALYSDAAKIRIENIIVTYQNESADVFTIAGITVLEPRRADPSDPPLKIRSGANYEIQWLTNGAPADDTATIEFRQWDEGAGDWGAWTEIVADVANVDGTNSYVWYVDPLAVFLNPRTQLRITSNTDPVTLADGFENAKLRNLSEEFAVAGMEVEQPNADSIWQTNTVKTLRWTSSGANDSVFVFYSIDDGVSWISFPNPDPGSADGSFVNNDGVNEYAITVPDDPTLTAVFKVSESSDPSNVDVLYANSETFKIAGIRINLPDEGYYWPMLEQRQVTWTHAYAGNLGVFEYSLDDGATWLPYASGFNLATGFLSWTTSTLVSDPNKMHPTALARVLVRAQTPPDIDGDGQTSDELIQGVSARFTIAGIMLTSPKTGDVWTINTEGDPTPDSYNIRWYSAGANEPGVQETATLSYSVSGNFDDAVVIAVRGNNESGAGTNAYPWFIPAGLTPSSTARLKVTAARFSDISDTFTLRGLKITAPAAAGIVTQGQAYEVKWASAGIGGTVDVYYSADGTFGDEVKLNAAGIPIGNRKFVWNVDPYVSHPSTTAKIRLVVSNPTVPADDGFAATSATFTLRGIRIIDPAAGANWELSQPGSPSTHAINWQAASAGVGVNIYYAADGVNYNPEPLNGDTLVDIATGTFDWLVGADISPSNGIATVKLVSNTGVTTVSKAFNLFGIRVLYPTVTSLWAVGFNEIIDWEAAGTGDFDVYYVLDGTATQVNDGGPVVTTSYDWLVEDPSGADPDEVLIRIVDRANGYVGESPLFKIWQQARIGIVSPAAGDRLFVASTYPIQWTKAGDVQDSYTIEYGDGAGYWQTIYDGPVAYDSATNSYSIDWPVTDIIDDVGLDPVYDWVIRISGQDAGGNPLTATSDSFLVAPRIDLTSPDGGAIYFVGQTITVSWDTIGSAKTVELAYSKDALFSTWTLVDTVTDGGGGESKFPNSYSWTIPAGAVGNAVKFRVRHVYTASSDRSTNPFQVSLYTLLWDVVDDETGDHLDQLAVIDSSGWSETNLTSPIAGGPYGFGSYTTRWIRAGYNDAVVQWNTEEGAPAEVRMTRTQQEPTSHVMANFDYTPDLDGDGAGTDTLKVTAWLERGGVVMPQPTSATLSLFDSNGDPVTLPGGVTFSLVPATDLSLESPGVLRLVWNATTLSPDEVYFGKVDILHSGQTYSSGVAYSIRIPSAIEETRAGVAALRAAVGEDTVPDGEESESVHEKLDDIRASVGEGLAAKVDAIQAAVIDETTGQTVLEAVGAVKADTEDILLDTGLIKGSLGVGFGILNRNMTVKTGNGIYIRLKGESGRSGTTTLAVLGPGDDPATDGYLYAAGMSEISTTGIYELFVTFDAAWGLGDFTVICSESVQGTTDSVVVTVTQADIDTVYAQIESIDFGTMSQNISDILTKWGTLDAATIYGAVDDLEGYLGTPADAAGTATVFGRIADLQAKWGTRSAEDLWTEANNAYNLINTVRGELGTEGQTETVRETLDNLWAQLQETDLQVDNIEDIVSNLDIGDIGTKLDTLIAKWGTLDAATIYGAVDDLELYLGTPSDAAGTATVFGRIADLQAKWGTRSAEDLWTEANNAYNLINTVRGELGTEGQTETVRETLDNLWAQLQETDLQVDNIEDIVSNLDIGDIGTKLDTLIAKWGTLDAATIYGAVDDLELYLGTPSDAAGTATVFGRIADLQAKWGTRSAEDLWTEANNAYNLINTVRGELGTEGQTETVRQTLDGLVTQLTDVSTQVTDLKDTFDALDFGTIGTDVQTLVDKWGAYEAADFVPLISTMSTYIGTPSDTTGTATLFGRILEIRNKWGDTYDADDLYGMAQNAYNMTNTVRDELGTAGQAQTLKQDIAQLLVDVGSLDTAVADMQTVLDTLDLTVIQNNFDTLMAQLDAVEGNIGDMEAAVQLMRNDVAAMEDDIAASTNAVNQLLAQWGDNTPADIIAAMQAVQQNIGTPTNGETVLGMLANVEGVATDAADASRYARRARTQATTASAKAQEVLNMLTDQEGTSPQGEIRGLLEQLTTQLQSLQGMVGQIPEDVKRDMQPLAIETVEILRDLQGLKGIASILPPELAGADFEDIVSKVSESRLMIQQIRSLIERSVHAPTVDTEWTEGEGGGGI